MDTTESIRIGEATLWQGDCRELMPRIPDASVNAVISDPPYPEISRPYGRLTEAQWWDLMREVVAQARRVLKPTGSAVFILQPNSERVGRMRPWLWEFMAWTAREWNQVQDAWWWNFAAMPIAGANTDGLMRPSVKACVWIGPSDCYRDQGSVLWCESDGNAAMRLAGRWEREPSPSGIDIARSKASSVAVDRGGVTPFNLIPCARGGAATEGGAFGHGAATPHHLADWWVRYISPPGGVVLDPFAGVGTIPIAALCRGRKAIAIEKEPSYVEVMRRRIERPHLAVPRPARAEAPADGQRTLFT